MEPKSPSKLKLSVSGISKCKNIWKICGFVVVILLLVVCACFVYNHFRNPNALETSYYTVVVDCGSTGTRVNVFQWKIRGVAGGKMPILAHSYPESLTESPRWKNSCRYHCVQTEPGLDKFVGNLSGIRSSLVPLILLAEKLVPIHRHRDTWILVLATAGLRKLELKDSRWVLNEVEAVLHDHAFRYSKRWIKVLSGKEEAYFGWLALNFRMGRFGEFSIKPTLGLLDLGGSSLQVGVEVKEVRDDQNLLRPGIGLLDHKVLAHSLPEFGLNEAFDRTVAMLSETQSLNHKAGGRIKIKHPCLGFDFAQNYTCYHSNKPSKSEARNYSTQMPKHQALNTYLVGDLNWEQCKAIAKAAAMNLSVADWSLSAPVTNAKANFSSFRGSDILNLTAIASQTERFHALSGFFAIGNTLNLSSRANWTEIWEKGKQICSRSWNASAKYAAQYCFRVPYMASLIEDALLLGDRDLMFGPGDMSWTLGAALIEGHYLWQSPSKSGIGISTFTNPIFVFSLLSFLLIIVYCSQIKLPIVTKKLPVAGTSLASYVHLKHSPN